MTSRMKRYSQFFAIAEIETSKRLQGLFWVLWALCIYDMDALSSSYTLFDRSPPLWEHLQNLGLQIWIDHFPNSYDYTKITALLLAALFASAVFAVRKNWQAAHFFLLLVVLWKFVWNFVLFDYSRSNFDYFHLIPALVFILSSEKLRNLRFVWVLIYFFTPFVKLDEGWIVGNYFSSLKIGLPFIPDSFIPLATNIVILFEMICAVGLIARNPKWARASLIGWTAFHLYSAILVGWYYPVRCLSVLWALFGFPQASEVTSAQPLWKTSFASSFIIVCVLIGNFGPSLISSNPNETFEGMNYGLHMINANHQCLNRFTTFDSGGKVVSTREMGSSRAMTRCYPQHVLQSLYRSCEQNQITEKGFRIQWQLWHSKDGEPFYEMVNVPNACELQYHFGQHNEWIHTPDSGAKVVGYPEKNSLYPAGSLGPLPTVSETPKIQLSPAQTWIREHLSFIKLLYTVAWTFLFLFLFASYFGLKDPFRQFLKGP